jgi:hypothetical protein
VTGERKVVTGEWDHRRLWRAGKECGLLIFENVAALEKSLLSGELGPSAPEVVVGSSSVVNIAKRRDDVADVRGHVPKVMI